MVTVTAVVICPVVIACKVSKGPNAPLIPEGIEHEVVVNHTKVSFIKVAEIPSKQSAPVKELQPVISVVKEIALELVSEVIHPEEIGVDMPGIEDEKVIFGGREEKENLDDADQVLDDDFCVLDGE